MCPQSSGRGHFFLNDVHTRDVVCGECLMCFVCEYLYRCFVNYKRTRNYALYLLFLSIVYAPTDGGGWGSKQELLIKRAIRIGIFMC